MRRSNSCEFANAYILVKGTITITGVEDDAAARQADERNKVVIFKICPPFTKCKSRKNNEGIDTARDIDIVMLMYNLIRLVIIIQKHLEVYGNATKINQMIT